MGYYGSYEVTLGRYQATALGGGMFAKGKGSGQKSPGTGGYYPYYFIRDDITDGNKDSATQLGDVSNDQYSISGTSLQVKGLFFGSIDDGSGFVGRYNGTYYIYAGGRVPDTVTVTSKSFPLCFAAGTLIQTSHGNVAVESLRIGDMAVTASGLRRPIRWLGQRTLDCATDDTAHLRPVRILAGAFAAALPARDLLLSPGHPVLVGADADDEGGHLVPIMCLINGTTIARAAVDAVSYWHVELDAHDILLAEGLPAESYLEWGDRAFFVDGADHALANPDFVVPGLGARCRPVALDGPVVETERRRLDAVFAARLAEACDWPSETNHSTPEGAYAAIAALTEAAALAA